MREVDSILHDLITQLVSVSIPIDKIDRKEDIKNLTPIINVSVGASAPNEPEYTFILGKLKPTDAETTIFDDLMKSVTCMELYPFYMELPLFISPEELQETLESEYEELLDQQANWDYGGS